ncbi:MAG TPA: hypothetical protein VJO16_08200 [Candidatus Acidoferrum sp.]|nr:hypothetical protein [Candidatus Acidoferrum sp.]
MVGVSLNNTAWVLQFDQHMLRDGLARRILYWQIDNRAIRTDLKTNPRFVDPQANLSKA